MLVVLMVDPADGVHIFEVLKRCGVRPADHLTAVQLLVGAKFDVTFKSAELKERFLPLLNIQNKRKWSPSSMSSTKLRTMPYDLC